MVKLFGLIFQGCWHKWEVTGDGIVSEGRVNIGLWRSWECPRCKRLKYKQYTK